MEIVLLQSIALVSLLSITTRHPIPSTRSILIMSDGQKMDVEVSG